MKRIVIWSLVVACAALVAPTLSADIKKREKTSFKMEGILGSIANRMAGGSDGLESTVALKGSRLATINQQSGQIIDLAEEKVYNLDIRKKEYQVITFAEMRAQMEKLRADAKKSVEDMKPEEKAQVQEAGAELEFDVKVDETGETKSIAGRNARQVILTITARQKGATLESGGGFVMTNDMWLAPAMSEMTELAEFQLKFFKAVYGEGFVADMQQMMGALAMFPALGTLAERMNQESRKLAGTPVMTTSVFEAVKSDEAMKAAQNQAPPASGGGLSGALARRMMANRGQPQQRTKAFTSTSELLSLETVATEADVAIPAGFKLKK